MKQSLKIAGAAAVVAATFGLGAVTGGAAAQAQGRAPQSCLDYIDHSQELMFLLADVIETHADTADAGFTLRSLERATDVMDETTPKVKAVTTKLETEEQACRGGKQ